MQTRVRPISTSDIGNIRAKLNVEEWMASVCRYRCWENINVKNNIVSARCILHLNSVL